HRCEGAAIDIAAGEVGTDQRTVRVVADATDELNGRPERGRRGRLVRALAAEGGDELAVGHRFTGCRQAIALPHEVDVRRSDHADSGSHVETVPGKPGPSARLEERAFGVMENM